MTSTEEHLRLQLSEAEETIKTLRSKLAASEAQSEERRRLLEEMSKEFDDLACQKRAADDRWVGAKAHVAMLEVIVSQLSGVEERAEKAEVLIKRYLRWKEDGAANGIALHEISQDMRALCAALKKGGE